MQPEVSIGNESVNYKKKYKTLKRKLRMLIYEQECFAEELRKAQRKLLRISRDKSFLLDRLLQYEKPDNVPSDSEATASSDSEDEHHPPNKKKKTIVGENPAVPALNPFINQAPKSKSLLSSALTPTTAGVGASEMNVSRKKPQKVQKKSVVKTGIKVTLPQQIMSKPSVVALTSPTKTIQVSRSLIQGQGQMVTMTQEELERHLELKQSNKSQFMSIEKTPMLPDNIFSNENSNSCDFPDSKTTDDEDLVIDMP